MTTAGAAAGGRRRRSRSLTAEVLILAASAVLIAVFLRAFVGQAFSIPSESMVPQLEVGDRVVVSKVSYELHDPRRGDVVVFDCPPGAGCRAPEPAPAIPVRMVRWLLESVGLVQPRSEEFIKRVVALPGETVEGREGVVWVDGLRLVEPYLPDGTVTADFEAVRVPDGHLWVMGDNRGNSSDSRVFGPVDTGDVVGRAVLRVWPPQRSAFL